MNVLRKVLYRIYRFSCGLWNHQYYSYPNISPKVKFSAAYPGIVIIVSPEKCSIGEGTVINADSVIHCQGGVKIGSFVHIGHGLCVYSSNHNYASERAIPYDDTDILKPVEIGDCVWIGANVSIVPGVKIAEGVLVSMGSVITCDVPAGAIVRGNPAKIIGYRKMDTYMRLKMEKKFN
jgi:maltose O-acetyltransferase